MNPYKCVKSWSKQKKNNVQWYIILYQESSKVSIYIPKFFLQRILPYRDMYVRKEASKCKSTFFSLHCFLAFNMLLMGHSKLSKRTKNRRRIKREIEKQLGESTHLPLHRIQIYKSPLMLSSTTLWCKKSLTEVNKCIIVMSNYMWIDYVCFFLYYMNRKLMLLSERSRTAEFWPQCWTTGLPWPALRKPDQMMPASQTQSTRLFKTAGREGMLYCSATNGKMVVILFEGICHQVKSQICPQQRGPKIGVCRFYTQTTLRHSQIVSPISHMIVIWITSLACIGHITNTIRNLGMAWKIKLHIYSACLSFNLKIFKFRWFKVSTKEKIIWFCLLLLLFLLFCFSLRIWVLLQVTTTRRFVSLSLLSLPLFSWQYCQI